MLIFLGLTIAAVVLVITTGLKIVQQSRNLVITRLGAYHSTLGAGVNIIVPFLDRVYADVSIADRVINDLELNVISSDNAVFDLKLLVVYRIEQPERAVFRVSSVDELVTGLVMSLVRSEIGKVELDSIQKDRMTLNEAIRLALAEAGEDYGVIISRSEIIDVRLSKSTEMSMAAVLNAERERRATVTTAEGQKRAAELNADASLYEETKQAEALTVMSKATAEANAIIADSMKGDGGEGALKYQIAKLQINALTKVAESRNTKVVMLPADATTSFAGAASILGNEAPTPPVPTLPKYKGLKDD